MRRRSSNPLQTQLFDVPPARVVVSDRIQCHPRSPEALAPAPAPATEGRNLCDPSKQIARNPRGMENLAPVGVFAQRTRFRPNPIGVTAVELLAVDARGITVRGLDALDGTPVLDIKPYIPAFERKDDVRLPAWVDKMMDGYF